MSAGTPGGRRRILMLAPQPFFEARGTPFSEYHRIKALGELGYEIDLITYPFGRDVELPGLRIIRAVRPPFLRGVRVGPSAVKVALDLLLAVTACRRALTVRYDAIHTHEEAGVLGVLLSDVLGVPHLYDMHSSLPQQLQNFGYTRRRLIRWLFVRAERAMIDGAQVIVTICRELQDAVVAAGAGDRAVLIENVMGGDLEPAAGPAIDVRATYGIGPTRPIILYTGTFEPYQGLDLLTAAAARLAEVRPEACVLVVGGDEAQVAAARGRAAAAGSRMLFTGQRPPQEIPAFVGACDILVSPRVSGTNTPLKIYSYLRSGRPIVATNLRTHTQVLTADTAVLVPPDAAAMARALQRLLDRPDEGVAVAQAAQALAERHYSRRSYVERTAAAYRMLFADRAASADPPLGLPPERSA